MKRNPTLAAPMSNLFHDHAIATTSATNLIPNTAATRFYDAARISVFAPSAFVSTASIPVTTAPGGLVIVNENSVVKTEVRGGGGGGGKNNEANQVPSLPTILLQPQPLHMLPAGAMLAAPVNGEFPPTDFGHYLDCGARTNDPIKFAALINFYRPQKDDRLPTGSQGSRPSRLHYHQFDRPDMLWFAVSIKHHGLYCRACSIFAPARSRQVRLLDVPLREFGRMFGKGGHVTSHVELKYHNIATVEAMQFIHRYSQFNPPGPQPVVTNNNDNNQQQQQQQQ